VDVLHGSLRLSLYPDPGLYAKLFLRHLAAQQHPQSDLRVRVPPSFASRALSAHPGRPLSHCYTSHHAFHPPATTRFSIISSLSCIETSLWYPCAKKGHFLRNLCAEIAFSGCRHEYDVSSCQESAMSVVKSQRGAMMLNIKAILQMKGGLNGGFLWACPVHTITGNDNMWVQGSATGVRMSDAFPPLPV
jgi:hypothetical protein